VAYSRKGVVVALQSFNIVLVGENFPVGSIRSGDFAFRHRQLVEKIRLPVALQAERDGVTLHVLPVRFQAAVTRVDQADVQAQGLVEMTELFFEYVGRRSVTSVGHNVVWTVEELAVAERLLDVLVDAGRLREVLPADPFATQLTLKFRDGAEPTVTLALKERDPGAVTLEFNFNFDTAGDGSAVDAVRGLPSSLQSATDLARRFEGLVPDREAVS
jgi:hypothetical protein